MAANRSLPVKIFITDYDACLLTNDPQRPDLLSSELINIAKSNNYAAWYGCTHRSYVGYKQTDFLTDWLEGIEKYNKRHATSFDPNLVFTRNITQAFEQATGLTCLRVSTPDDHAFSGASADKCGMGYETILQVYEKELIERNANLAPGAPYQYHIFETLHPLLTRQALNECYGIDKNLQLIQIMRHAIKHFGPDLAYEFHFFDDSLGICRALEKISALLLPPNVVIKSFRHNPARGIYADVNLPLVETSGELATEHYNRLFNPRPSAKPADAVKQQMYHCRYF